MASTLKLTCLVLVIVAAASSAAEAALTCPTVKAKLVPCATYLAKGGALPSTCCPAIRDLAGLAQTTADRQLACHCLQDAAKSMPSTIAGRAAGLPGLCRVSIPYAISLSTNCNSVK